VYCLPIGIYFGGLHDDGFAADGTQDGRGFLSPKVGKQKQQTRYHFRFQEFRDSAARIAHRFSGKQATCQTGITVTTGFSRGTSGFSLKSEV
jgi:hypothetical protein